MNSKYSPNAIIRPFSETVVGIRQRTRYIPDIEVLDFELSSHDVAILEIFSFFPDPEEAFHQYSTLDFKESTSQLYNSMCRAEPELERAEAVHIHIGKDSVQCEGFVFDEQGDVDFLGRIDLTQHAVKRPCAALSILLHKSDVSASPIDRILNFDEFAARAEYLRESGFLLPDVGEINWGDLRRSQPLCQFFGFMRGTPIDRYYLDRFIESIQNDVQGLTLEIGGQKTNRELYALKRTSGYRVLDLPGWSDDIVGDANDSGAVPEENFDSILILNVLEHCENPQKVVDNIYRWLKPGGHVYAMVPCAQRIHPTPRDFWRPMPDGLKSMFKAFRSQKVTTYGNVTTVVASFHGIAAEELTPEELDFTHPDYPVICCLTAQK